MKMELDFGTKTIGPGSGDMPTIGGIRVQPGGKSPDWDV